MKGEGNLILLVIFENPDDGREVRKNIDDSHVEKSAGDEETLLHTLMIHGLPDDWMEQVNKLGLSWTRLFTSCDWVFI